MDPFFIELCILWQRCVPIRSGGAATTKRRLLGLAAKAKNVDPSAAQNYCIIQKQALASEQVNLVFHKTMGEAVNGY
jgi:hypothetical protein